MKDVIKEIDTLCKSHQAKLVIVSKMRDVDQIEDYYINGYRDFGENKVQELLTKVNLHDDIHWHFIGRLQTNKVRDVVKYCYLLHSLNRYELIDAVQKEANKQNRIMPCLIQFNIAEEETKSGFNINEAKAVIEYVNTCPNIVVWGIMCMGPHVKDEQTIRSVFKEAKQLFEALKKYESDNIQMKYLSMGMSGDYEIALEEGSTMARIGSILF
ncbi:MAG: YggS family pyridoxal phosphate-dependent enzyme [Erysipelotrichales bacterium]|nr:YggS family pyridoxal phosphate-dependent enzyme [Erysipelotrichales bacterium]